MTPVDTHFVNNKLKLHLFIVPLISRTFQIYAHVIPVTQAKISGDSYPVSFVHTGTDHLIQPEGVMHTSAVSFIPTQSTSFCSLKLFLISTYANENKRKLQIKL